LSSLDASSLHVALLCDPQVTEKELIEEKELAYQCLGDTTSASSSSAPAAAAAKPAEGK
jgi:hypothetical protein